jgi:hypothetical protein
MILGAINKAQRYLQPHYKNHTCQVCFIEVLIELLVNKQEDIK